MYVGFGVLITLERRVCIDMWFSLHAVLNIILLFIFVDTFQQSGSAYDWHRASFALEMLSTGFSTDILIFICVAFLLDANIYKIGIAINFYLFLHSNLAKDDKIQTLITKRRNHILLSIFFTADFTW